MKWSGKPACRFLMVINRRHLYTGQNKYNNQGSACGLKRVVCKLQTRGRVIYSLKVLKYIVQFQIYMKSELLDKIYIMSFYPRYVII